jgi:hypothetical protein
MFNKIAITDYNEYKKMSPEDRRYLDMHEISDIREELDTIADGLRNNQYNYKQLLDKKLKASQLWRRENKYMFNGIPTEDPDSMPAKLRKMNDLSVEPADLGLRKLEILLGRITPKHYRDTLTDRQQNDRHGKIDSADRDSLLNSIDERIKIERGRLERSDRISAGRIIGGIGGGGLGGIAGLSLVKGKKGLARGAAGVAGAGLGALGGAVGIGKMFDDMGIAGRGIAGGGLGAALGYLLTKGKGKLGKIFGTGIGTLLGGGGALVPDIIAAKRKKKEKKYTLEPESMFYE